MKSLFPTTLALLLPLGLHAADSYDGISYTANTNIIGQNGGTGWTGPWSATGGKGDGVSPSAVAASLGYTDSASNILATTGGKLELDQSSDLAYRTPSSAAASSRWISFLLNTNGGTGGANFTALTLLNGTNALAYLAHRDNVARFLLNNDDTANRIQTDVSFPHGETAFMVVHVEINSGSDDVMTVWLNPDLNASELDLFNPWHETNNSNGYRDQQTAAAMAEASLAFDSIRFGGNSTGGDNYQDELRVGSTFTSVAPIGGVAPEEPTPATPKYNVVFMIADDLTSTALGCYGNTVCQTPNIDSLAAAGTRYDRSYCQYPVCAASRASFMFSSYPHGTNMAGWSNPRGANPGRENWGEYFKNRGYYSARVSKIYHMKIPNDIRDGLHRSDDLHPHQPRLLGR